MNMARRIGAWAAVLVWTLSGVAVAAQQKPAAPPAAPASCSPALEQAAADLAAGRLDAARGGFEKVAADASAPAFVRGLANFGLAETALARKDGPAATAIWRQMADDATLPQAYRDGARRRAAETRRVQQGLPPRDPAEYQAKLPALPEPARIIHVAPQAGTVGDGSEAKPFSTLEMARNAIRAMKQSQGGKLTKGGVRVVVHGGTYAVRQTLTLGAEDSGTAESPVVYQAQPGQTPIFSGSMRIPAWKPISDAALREKLDASVRSRVLEADLKALGLKDWGDATGLRVRPELFCNGAPQTLARWPNEGFVKTGQVLGELTLKAWNNVPGSKEGRFHYLEDRPGQWLDEPDVRLYGYWFWDWSEEYQKVASIDRETRVFTLAKPWSNYGYRKDQRYCAVNVFRELDQPGEWYLDRRAGMVYWLPPEGVDAGKAVTTISVFSQPFVVMENVEHVLLLGLTFEEGRGDGIHIRRGAECLLAGCTVRRMGGDAISVQGGQHHGVFGCVLHTLGCGGARIAGGDRKTLAAGGHFIENCAVYDISRLKRTYTPAVHLDGCGNRIAHNLFERIPSSAMRIEGNDHIIELNTIRQVVQESDDQGALDMWGNPLYRGVVIRWNRWSDIVGGTLCGAAGVRLDDMISGVAIYGNIFERTGAVLFGGVQVHGGKENLIDGNVFLNCHAGVSFTRWGEKRWLEMIQNFMQQAGEPPHATKYPELAGLTKGADVNFLGRNVFAACKGVYLRDGNIQRSALNTLTTESVDPAKPPAGGVLFEPIPVGEIGPYSHPWRVKADSNR